jgi:hypothetical protein
MIPFADSEWLSVLIAEISLKNNYFDRVIDLDRQLSLDVF